MSPQSPNALATGEAAAEVRIGFVPLWLIVIVGWYVLVMIAALWLTRGKKDPIGDSRTSYQKVRTLEAALMQYKTVNMFHPSQSQGLEALVTCPSGDPQPKRWSQWVKADGILDAWGRKIQYRIPGNHNPSSYDIFSFGPDGIESADDIGNW